jgi:hypothetical protein
MLKRTEEIGDNSIIDKHSTIESTLYKIYMVTAIAFLHFRPAKKKLNTKEISFGRSYS